MFEALTEAAVQAEPLKITLMEMGQLFCGFVPVGVLIGSFPLLIGFTVSGIMKIFKQI